ncbi:MAG: hypothetical protein Q8O00_04175 [Holophaga sp.]|nr:hypothetical protein [Holophaga sp.]
MTIQTPTPKAFKPTRLRAAWIIAIAVDALQLGLFPITGTLSTWVDNPLDLAAMSVVWYLVGWHWALLPTFVVELVPFVELVPTWTLALWLISRRQKAQINTIRP